MSFRRLWLGFALVVAISFAVLAWVGVRIYQSAPPVPDEVVTTDGRVIVTGDDIRRGQNVWQSMGGMEMGSVWGHGSYIAPDWTADWLHRELVFVLDTWSTQQYGRRWADLPPERQAELQRRVQDAWRPNTYDGASRRVVVQPARADAFEANAAYYANLFSRGRNEYAIPRGTLTDPASARELSAFFFWTAWAASTNRPDAQISYTSNWPHEELVGNRPSGEAIVWTGVSIILLLAGIGAMAFYYASLPHEPPRDDFPAHDPLLGSTPTPSQLATVKYFWTVAALVLVQIVLGVVTAHYGVEGASFYGIPLATWLPYTVTRTWHLQLGIFWIATAWLAAGLYIAPAVGGVEPRGQRLGVNVLFVALLVVVVGSLAGEWVSVKQHLTGNAWFYLGHSGYEYIDLGRLWQIALFAGLLIWLALMFRGIRPALARGARPGDVAGDVERRIEQRPLLLLFGVSIVAIAGFYAAALVYTRNTNLAVAEYWRWWVVHLWVEGFFEVFATVVISFLFARLGLVQLRAAAEASLLSATIFLAGGIVGTLHHLYFAGTPTLVLALGAVFSALEVVPLLFVGFDAWHNYRLTKTRPWVAAYKWPIYFFIAVAFWNLVGAGLFGFMINPPIALYFMQGLNTTPVHGHAALFGVYGMLGMGLILFSLRALQPGVVWKEGLVRFAFWGINIGLFAMVVVSLLPVGLMQTWASVQNGYWFARSAEFLQSPVMQTLRWMRIPGDTLFAAGAIAYAIFVVRLRTGGAERREVRFGAASEPGPAAAR